MVFSDYGKPYRLKLQFFAADGGGDGAGASGGAGEPGAGTDGQGGQQSPAGEGGQQGGDEARYTLEEVQKLIQSETDKRITQAQKKWQKEHERALALAGMSDDARAAAQKDDRIKDLEAKLQEANRFKARSAVVTLLSDKGLPAQLADAIQIDPEDDEMNAARVNALDTAIRAAVEAQVKQRLAGHAPGSKSGQTPTMTREQYRKLSLNEKQQLARTDPETYKQMNQ